ncbi:MAG: Fe-S cluster biosynthesis and repair protein YggX [Bradymonadia bacterium]|jgi:Fe-S cluster biosynthesis and repair protein YggX
MSPDERIEQFRKMAKANPDDDLAHFALGQALIDSDRHAEAVPVLRHVVKMNPGYSRAWVLLGDAQAADDDPDAAIDSWQTGQQLATQRGDLLPANEMKAKLKARGIEVEKAALVTILDETPDPDAGREPEADEVRCIRTRRIGKRMTFDPFGDATGAFIQAHVCQKSWDDWMEMSIKVINELRLDLGDASGQLAYDENMRDFLNLPNDLFEKTASTDDAPAED